MKSTTRLLPFVLAATVSTGMLLTACGSSDNSPDSPSQSNPQPLQPAPAAKPKQGSPSGGATAPASAGFKRKKAPDDAISNRPGGPKG